MNTPTKNSITVFSKTVKTSTPSLPLNFSEINPESKLFNGWFSGNTTNFSR